VKRGGKIERTVKMNGCRGTNTHWGGIQILEARSKGAKWEAKERTGGNGSIGIGRGGPTAMSKKKHRGTILGIVGGVGREAGERKEGRSGMVRDKGQMSEVLCPWGRRLEWAQGCQPTLKNGRKEKACNRNKAKTKRLGGAHAKNNFQWKNPKGDRSGDFREGGRGDNE